MMSIPLVSMAADIPFLGQGDHAGWLALFLIKAGYVETNPSPTNTPKQVWIISELRNTEIIYYSNQLEIHNNY